MTCAFPRVPADPSFRHRIATVVMAGASMLLAVLPVAAQPEVIRCLAPEPAMTALPDEVLAEYRSEIAAEFETYFTAISDHIACLDEERARALEEARVATETYSTLINSIPAAKDLP